jgi:DNA-binding CsgD family transcriptional regulator
MPGGRQAASVITRSTLAVRVWGDDFTRAVADQARADGFTVLEEEPQDAAQAVLVVCWPQATAKTVSSTAQPRERGFSALVAVVGDVPTPHLIRALALRLDGVVLLESLAQTLAPTLRAVLAGQTAHPLAFREHLERPLLSPREKQVLAMVVLGLTNAEIAQKLFVTEASIKAHLTSAFAKLGVRSREAAAALILDPEAGYGPGILRITSEP